ncbi:MAG: hypothetical protein R3A48_20740 [Polyangiales bacterium]
MARTKTAPTDASATAAATDPAAAFASTENLRAALPPERVAPPPAELRPPLEAARSLAAALADPAVLDRFARIPRDLFDPAGLSAFGSAIAAFEHARSELEAAMSAQGEVTLSEELAANAHALRGRMLKVVIHYFEDDEQLAGEVRGLGRKKGHAALAADLRKLAEVYDAQRAVVERDPKYWREGDADEARAVAASIEALLDAARGEAEKTWGEAVARAWSLLASLHEDLAATARWLFRAEGGAERFVPMPAAPRKRGPRAKASGDSPA